MKSEDIGYGWEEEVRQLCNREVRVEFRAF